MNIRQLFRRTTTPRVPAQPPAPAWEQDGHFQVGDPVLFPPGPAYSERVAWVRDGRVGVITNPALGTQAHADPSEIRHRSGCVPCTADAAVRAAAEEERENAYWDQWPADERELHDVVMEDMQLTAGSVPGGECPSSFTRYKFGPDSPVREWMRTELDGHLVDSESPSLSLGRIWDPLDWLRIEQEHADDGLTFEVPWEGTEWPAVRSAYALAREAGLDAALDVDLEMVRLDDGTIGADAIPSLLMIEGMVPDEVECQISELLGRSPDTYPQSHLMYPFLSDGPGCDFTAPYRHSTYDQTVWSWC
ncbi:hypothetical protein [Streptomyces sp. NPDC055036]